MIAVVEDDASMRRAITRITQVLGYAVRGYESAEAFLADADLAQEPPACLILDLHLGGLSGLELVQRLVETGERAPPFIMVTALEEEACRQDAEEAGCVAYLRKPFEAATLIDAIHRAIGDTDADDK
jgi:FixJ family two-component response regulator